MADYDRKPEYDEYVKEHVKAALLACDRYGIPAFMTFAVANGEDAKNGKTDYVTEMLSAGAEGVSLVDDALVKHALVVDGFDVAPFRTIPSVEEELASADAPAGAKDDDPFAALEDFTPARPSERTEGGGK